MSISRSALIKYLLNLSTRQFQTVDFVLPVYDMKTRIDVSRLTYVRSILPSRILKKDGTCSTRAEAFGLVSNEDLNAAKNYKLACGKAARQGSSFPPVPKGLNVAMDFFTDIKISTQPIQHSQAAASANRQEVYAAHNTNGKAQIWFTFSPDDSQSFKVVWYALDPCKSNQYKKKTPSGEFRFKLLAKHPVAAALHFEKLLDIVIARVIGWDVKSCRPFKRGGLFGIPKAWLRVVEEQSRLTLHAHFLIWLYGHENIEDQIRKALYNEIPSTEDDFVIVVSGK